MSNKKETVKRRKKGYTKQSLIARTRKTLESLCGTQKSTFTNIKRKLSLIQVLLWSLLLSWQ